MADDYFTSGYTDTGRISSFGSGQRKITLEKAIEDFFEDENARGLLPRSIEGMHHYVDPLIT